MGRGPAFGTAGPVRRHLAISTERSTHAILEKLSFGNGSMRKERNSSRDRSKTFVWCSAVKAAARNVFLKKGSTTRVEASPRGKKGQTKMSRSSAVANKWLMLHAFYMSYEEDSAKRNVQRVLQQGYQVNMRPRSLPLDVKIEIVKHSNRHHDGIKIILLEMIAGVSEVQQAFANSLAAKHVKSKTCAPKGDYTYYGMYAKYAKENHAEMYGRK